MLAPLTSGDAAGRPEFTRKHASRRRLKLAHHAMPGGYGLDHAPVVGGRVRQRFARQEARQLSPHRGALLVKVAQQKPVRKRAPRLLRLRHACPLDARRRYLIVCVRA